MPLRRFTPIDARNIWVQEYPRPGATRASWAVFDSSGALLGEVGGPLGLELHHIGDRFVLGLWRDDLDGEYVRLYDLDKP